MVLMYIFIGMEVTGAILLIWEYIKYTYNLDDKPKASKPKVTDIPTRGEIECYNKRIDEQMVIYHQKAKQHIIDILDIAYKDYINKQMEKGNYIDWRFILDIGDYGLTSDEILAIRDNPFSHGIYKVEYRHGMYRVPYYLIVTVEYIRKEN